MGGGFWVTTTSEARATTSIMGSKEEPYRFADVPTLLRDFWKDVRRLK
jgi:hypothetical protein